MRSARAALEWFSPELFIRVEILRVFAPLAILGFLASRIAYADQWISEAGFCLPDLCAENAHEAAYVPALSATAAWWVAAALVLTGLLANVLPGFMWTVFQALTLGFECFALFWLGWKRVRLIGLGFALGMHLLIGLMFGPVIWFSLLMITLLLASYLPDRVLQRLTEAVAARTGL